MRIAIYDMDGTLLSGSTFTPFLVFAAKRMAPWRLVLLPLWVALMIGHKLGFADRTTIKSRGMKLMLGSRDFESVAKVARSFADARIARLQPGARRMLDQDAADGWLRVLATAAYGIYAERIAERFGIEHVIATHWQATGEPSPNCYGPEKLARVQAWFAEHGLDRAATTVKFVSDSFADAPMLDWADEAWFVTADPGTAKRAEARGWKAVEFRH